MRWLVAAAVVGACASSGPSRDVQIARQVHYDVGIDVVYQVALEAVRTKSQHVGGDPNAHRVRTAWAEVEGRAAGDYVLPTATPVPGQRVNKRVVRRPVARQFVRFDVDVLGERPYEVRVVGYASEWRPGMAEPMRLSGADEPGWVIQMADDIRLAIYERLQAYAR